MIVETLYEDSTGVYRVKADVRGNNRSIQIIDIYDNDYGSEAEWSDFSDSEQQKIHNLLMREFHELDNDNGDDYNDEEEGDSDEYNN